MIASRLRDALQIALRLAPWPTEPGLRRSGDPGPFSPVIVTGNYDLSVRRVLRALEGTDAWIVVAPSSGINVWCAAAGGHFGTHQVVTALKTSGVEECVRHRRAVLPQLAATGVLPLEVSRRCGWRARFGPVYAEDLPRYLAQDCRKSDDMRHVRFGARERLEMAGAWAAPAALLVTALAALVRPAWSLPLAGLAVALAIALFTAFDSLPEPRRLIFGGLALAATLSGVVAADGGWAAIAAGVVGCVGLTGALTFDYPGSTPIEGGSHFEERDWRVVLDRERCKGVFSCWEVCPEACFEKPPDADPDGLRRVDFAHADRCVRCGACVVQCPMDALAFEDARGQRIEPAEIRRFKLDLLGRRRVAVGAPQAAGELAPPESSTET